MRKMDLALRPKEAQDFALLRQKLSERRPKGPAFAPLALDMGLTPDGRGLFKDKDGELMNAQGLPVERPRCSLCYDARFLVVHGERAGTELAICPQC